MTNRVGSALVAAMRAPLFFLVIGLGGQARAADEQPAPLIPLSSFATVPMLTAPNLSPDGTAVALRMRKGPEQFLVIHDLTAPPGTPGASMSISLGKATLNWIEWADKRFLVVSVRMLSMFGAQEVPFDRLVLVDRAGQMPHKFLGPEREGLEGDDVIYWAPDGSYLLLSVARSTVDVTGWGVAHTAWPRVMRVDIPSNKLTKVQDARDFVYRWVANSRGEIVASMGISRDGRLETQFRATPDAPFESVLRVAQEGDSNYIDDMFIWSIDADSMKGYVVTRRGGDRWGLYEYDFRSKTVVSTIFANEKYDLGDIHIDRRGKLLGTSYVDDRRRTTWFEPETRSFVADVEKTLPDRVTDIVAQNETGTTRIVRTMSPTDPGTYWLYTMSSRGLRPLASVNDDLRGKPLAPMRMVSYAARDGLEIPAYLTLPVGRPASGLPLIVMPHGGPMARDDWGYDFLVQYLANRGYAVLQPNFRGSTGYGKAFEERGNGEWGKAMQNDVDDGVKWLASSGTVDPKRVCMVGWSYGGFAAQVAAFRNPDLYRCAVSVAGISDLPAMLAYDRRFMFGDSYREWRDRIRGDDSTRSLNDVSLLEHAKDIAMPLLLVHGTDDDRVPVEQSDRLAKALKKAGKPFEYVRIPDGDHSLFDSGQRAQLLAGLEKFLAQHNPTDVLK